MFDVNRFCLSYDKDLESFTLSKELEKGIDSDNYNGVISLKSGELVASDKTIVVSYNKCFYYTTSNMDTPEILKLMKSELVSYNKRQICTCETAIKLLDCVKSRI